MSDQLQDQAPIPVQDCTIQPSKQPKIKVSRYKQTKDRGNRLPSDFLDGPIYEFSERYGLMLRILPKVKTANQPIYNSMFSRKFMILVYLAGIQKEHGYFSVFSIQQHFRQTQGMYADHYLSRIIGEGWAFGIDVELAKHRRAVLSPLFFSLIQSITNTLRREYPERFKAQDLAALSPEIKAMKPESSVFDFVTAIPDLR